MARYTKYCICCRMLILTFFSNQNCDLNADTLLKLRRLRTVWQNLGEVDKAKNPNANFLKQDKEED